MIEKAVEQRPEDGYIVDSLGWVLYRFGEFDRALKHLERAVELRPVDPVINDHFGDALWMVGRKIEARFQWKRALSFEPEEKDAVRMRRKLDVGLNIVLDEEREKGLPGSSGGIPLRTTRLKRMAAEAVALSEQARAKINLYLHLCGQRADGITFWIHLRYSLM